MITKGAAMFIIDVDGRRIQVAANYVLKSGESLALPLSFADAAVRAERRDLGLTDAYGVVPAGHRPGYVFVADRAVRDAAAIAYEERNKWLQDAWRHRHGYADAEEQDADARPPPPRNLADAQAAAERAYAAKITRLQNAWRDRDAA
jgi:hypothetical protein